MDPRTGYLQFTLPLGTLGGDLPVPIVYRFSATHVVREHWEALLPSAPGGGWMDADEPAGGGLHFGSVGGLVAHGAGLRLPRTSLLEDGTTVRWNSVNGIPGGKFSLPQAFGLGPFPGSGDAMDGRACTGQVPMPPATLSADGRYAWYATSGGGDLGAWAAHIQLPEYPDFVAAEARYHIVLTQDLARIYVETCDGPVPVLWADRFGHKVVFVWKKTMGPAPFDAIVSVKIWNDQGQGVLAHWPVCPTGPAHAAVANLGEIDLLRVDWLGVQAPAIQVRGLPASTKRPPDLRTRAVASGEPVMGPLSRPTRVRVGNPAGMSLPDWPLHEPVPACPAESPWAPDLTWGFTYDEASASMVRTCTNPLNTVTTFSYVPLALGLDSGQGTGSCTYFMGVTQAVSTDAPSGATCTETWDRTLPNPRDPMAKWECRHESRGPEGIAGGPPPRIYRYPDSLNGMGEFYSDGVLVSEAILDPAGLCAARTTYGYQKGGLTMQEPLLISVTTERQGEPTRVWRQTCDPKHGLPLVETTWVGGVQVEAITHDYETRWDLAIPGRETLRTVVQPLEEATAVLGRPGNARFLLGGDLVPRPVFALNLNDAGRGFIMANEGGDRAKVYLDSADPPNPTAGVGHLLTEAEQRWYPVGVTVPQKVRTGWFSTNLTTAEGDVKRLVTSNLFQYQYNALVDFSFQMGGGNLGRSNLLRDVNSGNISVSQINQDFHGWNLGGPGVPARRDREANLFNFGVYP